MAERRMFSKKIVESARFLRMPISTQALYFHLGIHADDDGAVEAFPVLRMTGCSEDDLRILVAKGFATVLNEDLVTYINDWNVNNSIRADRKVDSIYKDLIVKLIPNVQILEKKQRADLQKQILDNQLTTDGQPTDSPMPTNGRLSIGKDSIGKYNNTSMNNTTIDLNTTNSGFATVCAELSQSETSTPPITAKTNQALSVTSPEATPEKTRATSTSRPKSKKKPQPAVEAESEQLADVEALPLNNGTEWKPTLQLATEYERLYPNVDIMKEFRQMRAWCLANPSKKKTPNGIRRFVHNWLSREQNSNARQFARSMQSQYRYQGQSISQPAPDYILNDHQDGQKISQEKLEQYRQKVLGSGGYGE